MASKIESLGVLLTGCLLAGCTTTSIGNLTPRQQPRNPSGLYLVEAEWRSNQRSIRHDSLKPAVVIGEQEYPMRPTPLLTNRWEALVPVPAEQRHLNYQFKFDFRYNSIPAKKNDSKLSGPHHLEVLD